MEMDIRDVAMAALYTIGKENKTIISWDDVARYAEILEKRLRTNIGLVSTDNYDNDFFLDNVYCYVTSRNVYFSINPRIHPKQFKIKNIDELLLTSEEKVEFIKEYDETELIEAKKLVLNEYRNEYLVDINSLDEFLGTIPTSKILLGDFIAIYLLEYSRLCGNTLNAKTFEKDILVINKYLNKKGVHFINPDSFGLLALVNGKKCITKKANDFIISIDDVEEYNDTIISRVDINLYNYLKKLAEIYIIDSVLDPEMVFEEQNKKDI